jgi:hypothetical protein
MRGISGFNRDGLRTDVTAYSLEPTTRYSNVPPATQGDTKSGFGGNSDVQMMAKLGLQQCNAAMSSQGEDEAKKIRLAKQRADRALKEDEKKKEQARMDKIRAMAMSRCGPAAADGDDESDSGEEWD